jgi:hypothetical protein
MHICSCHGIPGVLLSCGRGLPHGVQDLRWFETVLTTAMKEKYEYIYIILLDALEHRFDRF